MVLDSKVNGVRQGVWEEVIVLVLYRKSSLLIQAK